MERVLVNQTIRMPVPEGFHVMSAEELAALFVKPDPNRWGMWDKERHVIITVEWQKTAGLALKLTNVKNIAVRNEQLSSKGYQNNGYQLQERVSGTVCGLEAEGYRFCYEVQGVKQIAESLLFVAKPLIYKVSCIGRTENEAADRALFADVTRMME